MVFDIYSSNLDDLDSVRDSVEAAAGVSFEERESIAGRYFRFRHGDETWTLHLNYDEELGHPLPDFPQEAKVLLHVEHIETIARGCEIDRMLSQVKGLTLLRRVELEK